MKNGHGDHDLTPVVRTLLDYFISLNPTSRARIVARTGSGDVVLHPRAAEPLNREASESVHLATFPDGTLQLVLQCDTVQRSEVARLADALRLAFHVDRETSGAARELSDRYEEINLLYSISEISGSVLATEEAAAGILAEILDVLSARSASLWIRATDSDQLELAATVGEPATAAPIAITDPDSHTARVFRENRPLNLEREPPGHGRDMGRPASQDGEALLSVPVHYTRPGSSPRSVGVITLAGRRHEARFSAGDERLLSAIANQIGSALESHRLHQQSLRQERLLRELELAHDLQLKLLPGPEVLEGEDRMAARCLPADSVGGDLYQVYRLSGSRLGILIGDVSGHGFAAALIMALTVSAIGIYAQETETPAEVLRRVHRALIRELENTEMYLSLFYCVLDPAANRIRYANAGHPQAYRVTRDGAVFRLGATGPPLGTVPVEPYGERAAAWQHGHDLLVLFTDGLSDTFAAARGSAVGEERLVQRVAGLRNESLDTIIDDVFLASDHNEYAFPADDRTLLLVRG